MFNEMYLPKTRYLFCSTYQPVILLTVVTVVAACGLVGRGILAYFPVGATDFPPVQNV
jgi:hypothetical protein